MDTTQISAITALVAVVCSPIVSVYITKRQIPASIVSSNRQKWDRQFKRSAFRGHNVNSILCLQEHGSD